MVSKPGKTPTLLCGSAGKAEFTEVKTRRSCQRCNNKLTSGEPIVEVSIPSQHGGHKRYCLKCFQEILVQTQKDLDKLAKQTASLLP